MGLDEALHDGESDSAARDPGGLRAPPEAIEDVRQLVGGDPCTGIGDEEVGAAAVREIGRAHV